MSFPEDSPVVDTDQTFLVQEGSYGFIFQWHALDSLKGIPLHPSFLKTALQELPDETEHIVQKS
jgi:hypothetical protein